MPRRVPPLTDIQVSKAKPKDRDYKLTDGGGLYLLVTTAGGKLWRFKYRFAGKEKLLAFGPYPEISLSDARLRRQEARRLLANDTDPGEVKKAARNSPWRSSAPCSPPAPAGAWGLFSCRRMSWTSSLISSSEIRQTNQERVLSANGSQRKAGRR